jgi:hypothetical protein
LAARSYNLDQKRLLAELRVARVQGNLLKSLKPPTSPENFELPFEGKLSPDNRWLRMANLIPWSEFEEEYAKNFSAEMGALVKSFPIALGALIIKDLSFVKRSSPLRSSSFERASVGSGQS